MPNIMCFFAYKHMVIGAFLLHLLPGLSLYAQACICDGGKEMDEFNVLHGVLPYGNPCDCHRVILGGFNVLTPTRPFKPIHTDMVLPINNTSKIRSHYGLDCTPHWGDWTSWSICSATCDSGSRIRRKHCMSNVACDGELPVEVQNCNEGACPTWSTWATWSECSTTCANGTRTRVKETCMNYDFPNISCEGKEPTESQACNHGQCPMWGDWAAWIECSVTCGNGTRTRVKETCMNSDFPGIPCEGKAPTESQVCNHGQCPKWGDWTAWNECSDTCGNGTRTRVKETCMNSDFPNISCEGKAPNESQFCNHGICPMWSNWAAWSECSTTCDVGIKTRVKMCMNPDFVEISCEGKPPTEGQSCDNEQCLIPLGMEDGSITDEQLSASSSYYHGFTGTFLPTYARLNHESSWYPADADVEPWIQVAFNSTVYILGIQTQGQMWTDHMDWVTMLQIQTGYSEGALSYIMDGFLPKTFAANSDTTSVVTIMLPQPICASVLRIHPMSWSATYCALRFEVLGGSTVCKNIA